LEAHIEDLTQQNAKLMHKTPRQSHPEENRDGHEEEECNSNTNEMVPRKIILGNKGVEGPTVMEIDGRMQEIWVKLLLSWRRCTYMEMERKGKSRSVVVDKLLMGADSPFTRLVADYRLPEKFKVPLILSYVGEGDPLDHLENFRAHIDFHGTPDEVPWWAFPLTLLGNAPDWFMKLPPNSIDKFKELSKIFLTKFLAFRTRKKPSGYLLTLHRQSNESLKDFMAWFNQEKITVEDLTEDMVFAAIYQGVSPEEPLMKKLNQMQLSTLQGLIDKLEECINEEETLKVMASSRLPRETAPEKKMKEFRKANGEVQRPVKKFKDYNFTSLNAGISEVLTEIKRDLAFRRPPKKPGNPPPRNEGNYCDFHEQACHYTDGSIALRFLIDELIKNGNLVWFLEEQRN
jgi:hypothetical protein